MRAALVNEDAMPEPQLIMLDVDACEPSDWNPNVEDLATFNELVENIRQVGMVDPIQVVSLGDDKYRIVGGEHRWKAARLAGLEVLFRLLREELAVKESTRGMRTCFPATIFASPVFAARRAGFGVVFADIELPSMCITPATLDVAYSRDPFDVLVVYWPPRLLAAR